MLTDEVCRQITDTVKTLRLDYPRLIMNNNGQRGRESLAHYQARVLAPGLAHHLAAGPIAFRQCRHCGYPPEEQRPVEYHRDSCAHGQVPYTPTACRFTHQDLLFMPEVYLPHPFRRCINHKDEQGSRDKKKAVYYDAELRVCPDCHQKLSQTPTHLFVLHMWAQGEALSKEQKVVHKDI